MISTILGKPVSPETNEFPENFRKGGGHFRSKKFHCNFFAFETAFFVMNFQKNLKKGGGHFRSEKFHCKFSAGATGLRKKLQYFFPKKGRGGGGSKAGVKGSEIFPKFIRFRRDRLP